MSRVIMSVRGAITHEAVGALVREFFDRDDMRRAGVVHAPAYRTCIAGFEAPHITTVSRQMAMFEQWMDEHSIELLAKAYLEPESAPILGFILFTETEPEVVRDAYARCATAALSPWSLGLRT